jgi:tRNA(Ile)-lysidine synthase
MSLEAQVKHIISSKANLEDRFLLAVSGGKDSMVLLHIFHQLGLNCVVAHMNYGLRDEGAQLDEKLVQEVTTALKVPFVAKQVNAREFCQRRGVAVQEGARILRYDWFEELLKEHNLRWIVTAHHEEDNKETFLQNLKRGSGLRGLKAMEVINHNRLKPMLATTREEIDTYVTREKVSFRQDASNNQNHYQRNLIRNKVLPAMESDLEGIGKGISSSISKLQADYDYLSMKLQEDANQVVEEEETHRRIHNYREVHPRLLFYILEEYGFNHHQVEDIMQASSSGKKLESKGYLVETGHGHLYIYDKEKAITSAEMMILDGPGEYTFDNVKIRISESEYPAQFDRNKGIAFLDADQLNWPLAIRNYQHGDKINPIGMKGTKKLSDYFTDSKVPAQQRLNKKVILSDEKIVWVVGELSSEQTKLTSQTKKVLKFETFG